MNRTSHASGESIDFAAIKSAVDLREVVERAWGPPARARRWACRIHGGDGANFSVDDASQVWRCFKCGAGGDVFEFLQTVEGLSLAEAAAHLDPSGRWHTPRSDSRRPPTRRPLSPPAEQPRPVASKPRAWESPNWQAAVEILVTGASMTLWSQAGRPALDWLRGRGLDDITLRRFRIGFVSRPWQSDPIQSLGTDDQGRPRVIRVGRGVVIPWLAPGAWYDDSSEDPFPRPPRWIGANVRRLAEDVTGPLPEGEAKYRAILGSERGCPYPWPEAAAPNWPAVLCEGELDTLLGTQEAGWVANFATIGGSSQGATHPAATAFMAECSKSLLIYDHDAAGDSGVRKLREVFPDKVRRLNLPGFTGDLTDFVTGGGNVLGWLRSEYRRLGIDWPLPSAIVADVRDSQRGDGHV